MPIVNPWTHPTKLTLKYHFNSKFMVGKFDKLVLNFRNFVADYITKNVIDICKLDSEDIEYCDKINFNAIEIASDIEKAINYNANEFRKDRFEYLLGENNMTKTSFTHSHDLIHAYKAPGIVFEIRVLQPDRHEFDMSITILDGYVNDKLDASRDSKDSESKESKVDKSEEGKSILDVRTEKAIALVDISYTQYKNALKSLDSNLTEEDVEKLEALSNTIRETSYSIFKPTTAEGMLEFLMAKGIIKPEFRMVFTSMFDNLIKDPLRYFFAKYEGAKHIEHNGTVLTLDFQFERKLYSMYFDYTNLTKLEDRKKLASLFKETVAELYKIKEFFLRDLLGATGDLITYLKLIENSDVDESNLSRQFNDYVYNKIMAFKTLASTYEADVFANNPTVAKCREMESSIDEITTKIQQWLIKSKTEIAKLFYTKLV